MCTQNLITRFFGMKESGPDPFGAPLVVIGEEAEGNPFRFSTKYADGESALVYFGRRYYAPTFGRFPNRDPIGEWGGIAVYVFVSNNPVNKRDRLGLVGQNDPPDSVISPMPCCDGVPFDEDVHCCCLNGEIGNGEGAKLVEKAEIESGVVTKQWPTSPIPGDPIHVWIEWDGGSADANAAGDGYVHSPAVGQQEPNTPTPVRLSPCQYNFSKLHGCLTTTASGMNNDYFGLCEAFVSHILSTCKERSRGCTVTD